MPVATREAPPVQRERRTIVSQDLALRASDSADGAPHIIGHASVFDVWTTLYESSWLTMREVIRPGAFRTAIAKRQDVRSLFNHDSNWVLGRTLAGTLTLREDSIGLWTDTKAPATPLIRDLVLSPIERKDISQMSFAFIVRPSGPVVRTVAGDREVYEDGGQRITSYRDGDTLVDEREVLSVDLVDVSPVTYAQYEQTDVVLDSRCAARIAECRGKLSAMERERNAVKLNRMRMRLRLAEAPTGALS